MRRQDWTNHRGVHPSMQVAYEQDLLQKNLWRSQLESAASKRRPLQLQSEAMWLLNERNSSFDAMHTDYPVYPQLILSGNGRSIDINNMLMCDPHERSTNSFLGSAMNFEVGRSSNDFTYKCRAQEVEDQTRLAPEKAITTEKVVRNLTAFGRLLEALQRWPLPRLSFTTACVLFLIAIFFSPRSCAETIIFPAFRLSFGTLYPAYASYKAVRTKNVKEYVKWMMYWIVYAFFTCIETFTDIFLSWFPFYYEVKVVIVLWLLSPATKGSSTLYRKFVHPMLTRREQEIDEYLNQAKERGYSAVLQLGSKGVNYATNVIMQTALKGGGNLVQTIRRSYSLSDLSEPDMHRTQDEVDNVDAVRPQQRMLRPRLQTAVGRSASGTRHSTGMYFTEVDVNSASKGGDFNYNIRSSEDISSGYSSAERLPTGLSRTSSMTNTSRTRLKAKRTEIPKGNLQFEEQPKDYLPTSYGFGSAVTLEDCKEFGESTTYYKNMHMEHHDSDALKKGKNVKTTKMNNNNLDDRGSRKGKEVDEFYMADQLPMVEGNFTLVTDLNVKTKEAGSCKNLWQLNKINDIEFVVNSPAQHELSQTMSNIPLNDIDGVLQAESNAADIHMQTNSDSDDDEIFIDALPINNAVLQEQLTNDVENDISKNVEKVSPRELQKTLQEIKDCFRATIQTTQTTKSLLHEQMPNDYNKKQLRVPLHNKGRAPEPPSRLLLSTSASADTGSISSISSSRSTSPSPRKGIFQSIKSNIFRYNIKNSNEEPYKNIVFETEI